MLALVRNPGESIVITSPNGDRITIEYVQPRSQQRVVLGITAPAEYSIHRNEIQAKIDRDGASVRGQD